MNDPSIGKITSNFKTLEEIFAASEEVDVTLRYWFNGQYGRWLVNSEYKLVIGYPKELPKP